MMLPSGSARMIEYGGSCAMAASSSATTSVFFAACVRELSSRPYQVAIPPWSLHATVSDFWIENRPSWHLAVAPLGPSPWAASTCPVPITKPATTMLDTRIICSPQCVVRFPAPVTSISWAGEDLNLRPDDYESPALTPELPARWPGESNAFTAGLPS